MNKFTIHSNRSWFTHPRTNERIVGTFLSRSVEAYYHYDYQGGNRELRETNGTVENIITTLKNQFQDKSHFVLNRAKDNLIRILKEDLPQILQQSRKNNLTVCVIPRSKAEVNYYADQLFFKQAVGEAVDSMMNLINGTNYIIRQTNTRTTHLDRSGYGGDGYLPYPGITLDTCFISGNVKFKDILLIDDLYTESVNIDEDAIEALFSRGAKSVVFYSIGRTVLRR